MGSTSSILAALIRDWSLSAWHRLALPKIYRNGSRLRGVIAGGGAASRQVAVIETYGDLNAIIGEDQGRVGRCELGTRHCEWILTKCVWNLHVCFAMDGLNVVGISLNWSVHRKIPRAQ